MFRSSYSALGNISDQSYKDMTMTARKDEQ
nr:MAG TPA: hypothetical protein [Caudoviricetes sp.]